MAGPEVTLGFAGDSTSLERTFAKVGSSAKSMASDLDKAESKTKSFGSALDTAGSAADASESKFMGTADVLDGLGAAFGLPTEKATGLFRAFGDLSGGFAVLQPLIGTVSTALKSGVGGALSFISAHPIMFTITALVAGFVLLWQHSETFQRIVRAAFDAVGRAASAFWDILKQAAGIMGNVAEVLIAPYRLAFNTIAKLWNSTVGKLSFKAPDWIPGIGGKGWDVPDIPTFHTGGTMGGPTGAPGLAVLLGGERVLSPAESAAGPQIIVLQVDGRELARVVTDQQRGNAARGFR